MTKTSICTEDVIKRFEELHPVFKVEEEKNGGLIINPKHNIGFNKFPFFFTDWYKYYDLVDDIVNEMWRNYTEMMDIYDLIKENLIVEVVSVESNESYLEDAVYMDLTVDAFVLFYKYETDEHSTEYIKITRSTVPDLPRDINNLINEVIKNTWELVYEC